MLNATGSFPPLSLCIEATLTCHPEAGEGRDRDPGGAWTTQAVRRYRVMSRVNARSAATYRMRDRICSCEVPRRLRRLGMTRFVTLNTYAKGEANLARTI
jgi:hypothetical protein